MSDYKREKMNQAFTEAKILLSEYQEVIQPFLHILDLPTFIATFNLKTAYNRRPSKKVFDSESLLQNVTCEIAAILSCLWWNLTQQGEAAILEQNLHGSPSYIPHAVAALHVGSLSASELLKFYNSTRSTGNQHSEVSFVHYKVDQRLQKVGRMGTVHSDLMSHPFQHLPSYLAMKLAKFKYNI